MRDGAKQDFYYRWYNCSMQLVASHLVKPQNLHMASFPGIRLDNCPEPEPPLEEAVGLRLRLFAIDWDWEGGDKCRSLEYIFLDRSSKSIINNPSTWERRSFSSRRARRRVYRWRRHSPRGHSRMALDHTSKIFLCWGELQKWTSAIGSPVGRLP